MHESKRSILNSFSPFRTISLPNQTRSFSTEVPKSCTYTILHSQDEKNSDNDYDNTVQDEDILVSVITKGKRLSSSEWEAIKDQVCAKRKEVNYYNIDAIVMGLCSRYMQLEMGLSYLDHLSVSGKELNIATIAQFMKLCYKCRVKGIDEQLILSMYNDLRSRCPVLDAYTAESAILGLCLTNHWKIGLDLLDMTKLTCSPGGIAYNALAKAAYDNNEPNIGLQLLTEMLQLGRSVRPEVFHAQLDYCDRASAGHKLERWKMVEKVLRIFVENDVKLTMDIAERLRVWCLEAAGPGADVTAEFTTLTGRYEFTHFCSC
jgi:hypothetical protein